MTEGQKVAGAPYDEPEWEALQQARLSCESELKKHSAKPRLGMELRHPPNEADRGNSE